MEKLKKLLGNLANLTYIGGNENRLKLFIKYDKWLDNEIDIENSAGIYILSNPINPLLKKIGFASMKKILDRLNNYGTYFPLGVNIEGLILFDLKQYQLTPYILDDFKKIINSSIDSEHSEYFPKNIIKGYNAIKYKKGNTDYLDKLYETENSKGLYLTVLARTLEIDLHNLLQNYKKNIDSECYSTKSDIDSKDKKVKAFGEFFNITIEQLLDELKKWKIHKEYQNAFIFLFIEPFFFGEYLNKKNNMEYTVYVNTLRDIKRFNNKRNIKNIKIELKNVLS